MMYQKELFANYELDDSSWYKTVLKLFGGSLVLHVIIFLSLIYIPAVRDAFYVALLFSDAPMGWSDKKEYDKTEFGEVTVINLPSADQLQYPEGYFELANGDAPPPDFVALTTPYTPEVVDTNVNLLDGTPPIGFDNPTPLPTPAPPVYTPLPAPKPAGDSVLPKLQKPKKGAKLPDFQAVNGNTDGIPQPSPTAQTEPKKDDTAKAQSSPSPSGNPNEIKLIKQPWIDLGNDVVKLEKEKKLDFNKTVAVSFKGKLDKDGKFVGQVIPTRAEGDPVMAQVAQRIVGALNESEMLRYIKPLIEGSTERELVFDLVKDDKQMAVKVMTDIGDEKRAGQIASGLNLFLTIEKNRKQANKDEEYGLIKDLVVTSEKNQVIINWAMPNETAIPLLMKKLAELPKEQQSTSQSANTNVQAVK